MVSTAPSTLVEIRSHHQKSSTRKSCILAAAVGSALYVRKKKLPLAVEKKMVSYKQSGSVRSTFQAQEIVISDVKGP